MPQKENLMPLTDPVIANLIAGANYPNKCICEELCADLQTHAFGKMPDKLIFERRPNESEAVKEYRAKIYVPMTRRTISKVMASLEKIRRSQDWSIQYDASKVSKKIAEAETLERYCESNYPAFGSLTNWTFSILLKKYLLDANAFVAVIPEYIPESQSEYVKPIAAIFDSRQIWNYEEDKYIVIKSDDTSSYTSPDGKTTRTDGSIYHILTPFQYARYEQIGRGEDGSVVYKQSAIYDHNIGRLPAFKVGGLFHSRKNNDTIFESRIAGMIPSLNEAAREYSDLQAEMVQHIHSEKWAFTNSECPVCHGLGKIFKTDANGNETGEQETCPNCKGSGSVTNVSPYGVFTISAAKFGENTLPAPPLGYVQKDTSIAKFADDHIKQHLLDALAAINMEFLADTPLAQSGVAKAYDKDELNNFVNGVAEDLVRILDLVYYYICEYRYMVIQPNEEARRDMLPKINVPTKYDIVNTSALMEELKAAKEAKVNPMVIRRLEIDYAKKQFCTDPEIAQEIECTFGLDPMFGKNEDEKMAMLQNGGVTKANYIISSNIAAFVQRALREKDGFLALPYDQQMKILQGYAEEVEKANTPIATPSFEEILKKTETTEE